MKGVGTEMLGSIKKNELIQKRLNKNLSQHRLSHLAGLGNNAVFRMENTECKVNSLRAKAVADVLNCHIYEIFDMQNKKGDLIDLD